MRNLRVVSAGIVFSIAFSGYILSACSFAHASQHSDCVDAVVDNVMKIMNRKDITMEQKKQALMKGYINLIDFEWNAKMALGRPYQRLKPDEQRKYLNLYKKFLIKVWMPKMAYDPNSHWNFAVQERTEKINDKDENVAIIITAADGKKYDVCLRVRLDGNICRALDVSVAGVDLAVSYRTQFASYIEEHGHNAASIIDFLQQAMNNSVKSNKSH